MNRIPITEAAKLAGITREQARYWSKLLDLPIEKDGRVSYLPAGSENLLAAMKKAVDSGLAPAVAAAEVKSVHALPVVNDSPIRNQDNAADKIADLEKAVLLMASTLEKQGKLLEQQAAIIAMQSAKLDNLTAIMLPPPQPARPINVWQPVEKKAPNFSWIRRAWLELIDPVKLRATP
jgi:hypothetical protein